MLHAALKPPSEMTASELDAAIVNATGLAQPPMNASRETWQQWYVACILIIHHRHIADPTLARERAIQELQRRDDFEQLQRYL